MKKTLFFALFVCSLLTSCTTYRQAGAGGCYFAKRNFSTAKQVVRIR